MDILHIEKKGRLMNTWDKFYIHKLSKNNLQMNDIYTDINNPIFDLNKLLIYKVILKPIWTYGIQLCGTTSNSNIDILETSNSNIEILERFQSKVLRLIVDAPWYVSNSFIRNDLQIPTVKEEISRFSSHYKVRISVRHNELIASLTEPPI
jgi:hypothetical protein